jgi:hypothetical protein
METSKCNKCTLEKPLEQFSKNKKHKNGVQNYCKDCASIYFAEFVSKRKSEYPKIHVESKSCAKCKQLKPRSQYSKRTTSKDGLNGYCKPCWRSYLNGRYATAKNA